MKKFLKWFIGIIALVLVLLVVAAGAFFLWFDPNDHKEYISEKVAKATGRTFTLKGDITLSYYPWLALELGEMTFGNASGFGDAPFMHADRISMRAKLMPLLKKQVIMDKIQIHGATLNLSKNKQGITNWQDLGGPEKAAAPEKKKPFPLAALAIGGLDIRKANITWNDQSTGRKVSLKKLNASTGSLTLGEPIDLYLAFTAESNQPALQSDLVIKGTIDYDLNKQQYNLKPFKLLANTRGKNIPGGKAATEMTMVCEVDLKNESAIVSDLKLNMLDTSIKGKLTAEQFKSNKPKIEGQLEIKGEDLAQLFKVAEIEPLATQLGSLKQRSFNIATSVSADLDQGNIAVPELNADLLGAVIKGKVDAGGINSKKPMFKGALSAKGPDLPMLLQIAGQFEGGGKTTLKDLGGQLIKMRQKAFDVQVNFDADLKKGSVDVSRLYAKGLGISVEGGLKGTDMNAKTGSIAGQLSITGENLPELLTTVNQKVIADVLQSITLDMKIKGDRSNLQVSPLAVQGILDGPSIPNAPVKVLLSTTAKVNLDAYSLTLNNLVVKGLGLDVNGNMDLINMLKQPNFKGDLEIKPFDLRKLMSQLKLKVPVTADKNVLKKVALKTGFSGSLSKAELQDFQARLDDTGIKGNFSVANFNQPDIKFNMNIDQLNADRYLPPAKKGEKARAATPETAAGAAARLPVETLRALKIYGDLVIGKLIINNARLSNINLAIRARDGNIKLAPVSADLYQGKYKGDVLLDATGKLPKLTLNTSLKGIQAEPLLKDVTGNARLRGKGDFTAALTTAGIDTEAMKKALNGKMSFVFKNGAVKGFNVGKFLRSLKQLRSNLSLNVSDQEETDFAEITGNPTVTKGVVYLNDLAGKSPAFRIQGKGMVADLVKETIDYDASVTVVETSKGQGGKELVDLAGITLPIKIAGSLKDPKIRPDISGIVSSGVTRELKKTLMDKIGLPADKDGKQSLDKGGTGTDEAVKDVVDTLKKKFKLPF